VLGGQVGYNYELKNVPFIGHAVVGVEVDEDWADVTGNSTVGTAAGAATFGTRSEEFGTARLRLGYNFDRLLLYVTGGFTWGSFNSYYSVAGFSGSQNINYARLPPRSQAVGIGAEYAIDNHWSVKAEYLYDAILAQFDTVASHPAGAIVGFSTRSDYSIIRLGVNYKFDLFATSAPAVAKY
jgi:outer membrane immunogenic protein